MSATTTLSCLILKKSDFDLKLALKLSNKAEIYCHSAAILASFHDKPAAFKSNPLLTYRQNSLQEEGARFNAYCAEKKILPEALFTTGVIRLIELLRRTTGIPTKIIGNFREPEIRKDTWQLSETTLASFVHRFAHSRLQQIGALKGPGLSVQDLRIVFETAKFLFKCGRAKIARQYLTGAAAQLGRRFCKRIPGAVQLIRLLKHHKACAAAAAEGDTSRSLKYSDRPFTELNKRKQRDDTFV